MLHVLRLVTHNHQFSKVVCPHYSHSYIHLKYFSSQFQCTTVAKIIKFPSFWYSQPSGEAFRDWNVLQSVGSDTFCVGDWEGQQGLTVVNRTVYCVTLWLLYVGRTGETSDNRLLWLPTMAAMMLDWGSGTLDITTAGIVGISYCWCGLGYCTVLMLAVLTDGRWKL